MDQATSYTCPDCKGSRAYRFRGTARPCPSCDATGTVTIDPTAIRAALLVSRGVTTGSFRRSRPALPDDGGVYGAAYVWRMIRFHAGLDMHLPVMAFGYIGVGMLINEQTDTPVIATLDALVERLGIEFFGAAKMLRATVRWGYALHGDRVVTGSTTDDATTASTNTDGVSLGKLADALGVYGVDGLDIGGVVESPEAGLDRAMDGDGNLDATAVEALLAEPARTD